MLFHNRNSFAKLNKNVIKTEVLKMKTSINQIYKLKSVKIKNNHYLHRKVCLVTLHLSFNRQISNLSYAD